MGALMKPTVAIVGSHPRTREAFDFARTDCDVWLFNEALSGNNPWAKRADMVFQMHVPAIWRNPANRNDPHHYEWLQTQDVCDVMMQDIYPDVPRSKMYPLGDIAKMLGVTVMELTDTDHFLSSSVPQAIALAILNGYKRVEVYGVAMETNTEYQFQREGVAFWIGFAKGHGVDLYFADPTFRAPLYGYEGKVSVEYDRFDERIEELQTYVPDVAAQHKAAVLDVRKALELFLADGSKDNENTLHACAEKIVQITSQLGALDGAIQENQRYKAKADKMREAADGEFVFSRQEFEAAASSLGKQANDEQVQYIGYGTQLGIKQDEIAKAPKGSPKREKLAKEFWAIFGTYLKTVNRMNIYKGAANENQQYMLYLDKYIRAAGGEKSEAVLLESMRQNEVVAA
jgi:hypothetical protein